MINSAETHGLGFLGCGFRAYSNAGVARLEEMQYYDV